MTDLSQSAWWKKIKENYKFEIRDFIKIKVMLSEFFLLLKRVIKDVYNWIDEELYFWCEILFSRRK
jgi:hypothetical protein